jgi:glycosyltransferase involved in cell wall biosynthesis
MTVATGPKKKILWHSVAPWAPTGYGQQTALFTPRIRDAGHDVAISSIWGLGGAVLQWEGMPVYPSDEAWGNMLLPAYADHVKADAVISLMDVWVLQGKNFRDVPLACWTPVDHQPCPPKVAQFFRDSGARPIAMSRFGEEMLQEQGLDPFYVPHGVDTKVFAPGDRDAIRKQYRFDDSFVVGIVANNAGGLPPTSGPPRKAFPESLIAFSQFHRDHPDSKLYLHTEMTGRQFPGNNKPGLNLPKLIEQFKIPIDAVMLSNQLQMELGIEPSGVADLYNGFDVLLNPSYGEGFGIPIVEAQACGTPVIVTDWTAMGELCGAGWKVGGDEPWYDAQHESFFMRPRVSEIIGALEDAYENAGKMRPAAREFALGYDADRVMAEHWLPVLDELGRPREVQPLNREMRRAAQKKAGAAA